MSVAPVTTNHAQNKRKLPGLAAWLMGLLALPLAIWIAYQAERHVVTHTGPGGPRTPSFGTIYLDELFGPQATEGGGWKPSPVDTDLGIGWWPEYKNDPVVQRFYANVRQRVTPYLIPNAYYDIWMAERCKARLSGLPFPSWQQAEEITVEEYLQSPNSQDEIWNLIILPIAADGSHPRRMSMFVANVAFYWIVLLIAAYWAPRMLHRRRRPAATGFPIELVEEEQA